MAGDDSWRFSVGAGVVSRPKYPGSDRRELGAVPLLSANYGRFFVGGLPGGGVPLGVGAYIVRDLNWKFGVGIGGGLGTARRESADPSLAGLGDIKSTPRFGAFGSFSESWLMVRGNVATDVGGRHQGTLVSIEAEGRWHPFERFTLMAGPGITWADHDYTQTFFGISPQQSAASGRPIYNTGAGIDSVRISLGGEYALSRSWGVGIRGSVARLQGDAAASPITLDRWQDTIGLFASYRF